MNKKLNFEKINFFNKTQKIIYIQIAFGIILIFISLIMVLCDIQSTSLGTFFYDLFFVFGTTLIIIAVTNQYNNHENNNKIKIRIKNELEQSLDNILFMEEFYIIHEYKNVEKDNRLLKSVINYPTTFLFMILEKKEQKVYSMSEIHKKLSSDNYVKLFEEEKKIENKIISDLLNIIVTLNETIKSNNMGGKRGMGSCFSTNYNNIIKFLKLVKDFKNKYNIEESKELKLVWDNDKYEEHYIKKVELFTSFAGKDIGKIASNKNDELVCSFTLNLKLNKEVSNSCIKISESCSLEYLDFIEKKKQLNKELIRKKN